MNDLKQAAQQALDALEGWRNYGNWVWPESALDQATRNTTEAITALKAALAAPQPEPVAFMWQHSETGFVNFLTLFDTQIIGAKWFCVGPVYLHPPQRQPLTLDQVSMIWSRVYPAQPLSQNVLNLVREVETMHGIGGDK